MSSTTNPEYDYTHLNHELDLTKSQVFLDKRASFFAPLMCSLNFAWNTTIETAATDGKTVWWNPADFIRCREEGKGEDVSTLMHELWHVGRLHAIRRLDRCPDKWNEAGDIVINRELKNSGYYVGHDWLVRPEFDKIESEEEIYELLKKPGGGGGGGGSQAPGQQGHGHCSHMQAPEPTNVNATVGNVVKALQAAQLAGKPGDIPGNMQLVIEKFLAPVIPWEQHLIQWMTDLAELDYTWARPNRRHHEMYLPSMYEDDGRLEHLIYFQDVSGSISNKDIERFNSELKYVWDTFKPKKMTVIQFDTRITQVDEFNEGDDFSKIVITGRGGTCLIAVRQMIIDMKPTAAIIFTDLQVTPMERLPIEIPILWVGVNAGGQTVPFGKLIHIRH